MKTKPEEKGTVVGNKGRRTLLFVGLAVASGLCSSMIYEKLTYRKKEEQISTVGSSSTSTLVASAGYKYINPLVSCSGPVLETLPFKSEIENYISGVKAKGKASRVSVQFKEMDNGYSFVINGKENYFPASLMKVHTMVLLLKKEMKHPGFLEQKVFFDPKQNVPSRNEHNLQPGKTYTVRQLMENMVKYSDNMSTTLLHDYASLREVSEFYTEIGLKMPKAVVTEAHQLDDFMQISDYTKIIRMLYNASYLSKDFSEYALSLLGSTQFNLGLTAGLPGGFTASHKYGVWKRSGITELHDCGIIYHDGKAYLLAVMTQGKDEYELADVIKGISKLVTDRVQNKIISKAG